MTTTAPIPTSDTVETHGLLLDGQRVTTTSQGLYPHVFPGDGRVNAEVAMAGPTEIDQAVASAAAAQKAWIALPVDLRRDMLLKLSDLIQAEIPALAALSVADNGVASAISAVHPFWMARWFRYYAGWIDKLAGQVPPVSYSGDLNIISEEPYGVVGVIVPWNGPMVMIGMAVAPALAAGNAVVIKPPELAPLTTLRFGELALEAGLPPGLVNVVPGDHVGGEALVRHPGVGKIHFTGSGATARKIHLAAVDTLTPVATELGGKSANLVFADTDLDTAVMLSSFIGPLAQSGQNCACGSRILVEDSIYDQFVEKAGAFISQAVVGDPFDAKTLVGPVIAESALDRILGVVETARSTGSGRLVTGGGRLGGSLADGFFIEPTLFADVDNASPLNQQETFGPVVSVSRFSDEEEAVALANDTSYGLVSYVQTNDLRRAHRVSRALQSGSVYVNTFSDLVPSAPYGGFKQSGEGRLGGLEGLREFSRPKNVRIGMEPPALPA
ncbi:aldehyde dehydrogenase family protein [Pseudonocardia pini]|uniref:aldehyde dehydrogenase family protein n=1 Tax=Pseudonocardia pini TaxID=2758030 RepID=UPI0015F11781|nr:aldehyde dehydrogenase family protein [Pseudonocardia pini]